jgi:hypothetical protein
MYFFCPRKDAEVLDLNALELCTAWGFSGLFHTKSMLLGQNKYIRWRFGGHMDTINSSSQSEELTMRLNVSTGVPTEVTTFFLTVESSVFEFGVDVEDYF